MKKVETNCKLPTVDKLPPERILSETGNPPQKAHSEMGNPSAFPSLVAPKKDLGELEKKR